jgi:hypothetical protein
MRISGLTPSARLVRRCERCQGTGRILTPVLRIIGTDEDGIEYGCTEVTPVDCPDCKGTGTLPFGG